MIKLIKILFLGIFIALFGYFIHDRFTYQPVVDRVILPTFTPISETIHSDISFLDEPYDFVLLFDFKCPLMNNPNYNVIGKIRWNELSDNEMYYCRKENNECFWEKTQSVNRDSLKILTDFISNYKEELTSLDVIDNRNLNLNLFNKQQKKYSYISITAFPSDAYNAKHILSLILNLSENIQDSLKITLSDVNLL